MKPKLKTKYILIISLVINILLIVFRNIIFNNTDYYFLIWNLFLAAIPLIITNQIRLSFSFKKVRSWAYLFLWLLFLPNAPYIVTDFVHLETGISSQWIDLLIIILTAINGMMMGFISIKQVEIILSAYISKPLATVFEIIVISASAYGVYMGRFMRYNSWDIFIRPFAMARDIYHSVGISMLLFVLTFSLVSYVFYRIFQVILLSYSQEVS